MNAPKGRCSPSSKAFVADLSSSGIKESGRLETQESGGSEIECITQNVSHRTKSQSVQRRKRGRHEDTEFNSQQKEGVLSEECSAVECREEVGKGQEDTTRDATTPLQPSPYTSYPLENSGKSTRCETPRTPTTRLNYEKLLAELKENGGNLSKAARAVGMSREVVYWRAKNDEKFKARLQSVKDELALQPVPTHIPEVTDDPSQQTLVPMLGDSNEPKPHWQRQYEASLRTYGLPPIAAIHAGVDFSSVERLLNENPEFAARSRQLCDEANSRILLFARERAMSGKADQVLLAWLKAYNDNFRDKSSVQVSGNIRHQHGHIVLTPQMLEQVEKAEIARREFIQENTKTIESEEVKDERRQETT